MIEDSFSIEDRILCSDGSCIGVVGPDRLCKLCGKLYEGVEQVPQGEPTAETDEDEPGDPLEETSDQASDQASDQEAGDPLDPLDRVCCSDETCIGIIGSDGKCGTCGKMP